MSTEILMPQLGESVVEGTVSRWLIVEGQPVQQDEPLLQVTTDKVDTDIPAPASGVILKIYVPEGQTVAKGTPLALIGDQGSGVPEGGFALRGQGSGVPEGGFALRGQESQREASRSGVRSPRGRLRAQESEPVDTPTLGFISPVVGRLAGELGVDLSEISGTGVGGRVTKKDVLAYAGASVSHEPLAGPNAHLPVTESLVPDHPSAETPDLADSTSLPLSPMRQAIARHMVLSKQIAPHATTVMEADMTQVVRARERLRGEFARRGVRLTFTPFFIQAIVAGIQAVPEANSSFRADALLLHRRIQIGVAVAIPDGLIVPVIRDAGEKGLLELARAVNDLAERARTKRLTPEEVQGGTFTLTNHGTGGSLFAMPILVQPQAGILGVGAIRKRPVVVTRGHPLLPDPEDAIAIRPIAYLSFTFDHRVLDGAEADRFLSTVKQFLEDYSG